MFSWLNTTGASLKLPRPDRNPNYLGAIARDDLGEKAFNASAAAKGQEGAPSEEAKKDEDGEKSDSETFDPNEEERKEAEKSSYSSADKDTRKKPRPRKLEKRDLTPFPLNKHFMSQPVLSEEFREVLYLKVVEEKMSVRSVSAEYGVSMERVAAVVRMKQMERDWVQQVSRHHHFPTKPDMMIPFQNSISL
jgi:hypothetical protein